MISPVSGHLAQYRISEAQTKANGAISDRPGRRSGRCSPGELLRSDITLVGPVRYEITVATEMTAASAPQPRKKNRKMNDTARLNHMAERDTPKIGCTRPNMAGMVLLRSIA